MKNPPIHWSEGMFLRPHHFQAQDRHWYEFFENSIRDLIPYAYGIRFIEISEQAIANYQIEVSHCEARMRDGSIISIGGNDQMDRVDLRQGIKGLQDLKEVFLENEKIRVYLAVPRIKLGHENTARDTHTPNTRYYEFSREDEEENRGGNPQEVSFRELNIRILLSTDDLSGFELMPICQIVRNESDGTPRIDPNYHPPCLAVDAWTPLGTGIVRRVFDLIGERIERFRNDILNQNITWDPREIGDLEKMMRLRTLNEAYGELRILAFSDGIHPLKVYTALCRIIGQLAIFDDKERRIENIPKYDHENLADIFQWAYKEIRRLSEGRIDATYEHRFFLGSGQSMHVQLDPKWFDPSWEWYIGFEGVSVSKEDTYQLVTQGFHWVFGSGEQVETLFRNNMPGVRLRPVAQPPRVLPQGGNWVYFQVQRQGPPWDDVQRTQTMGWRFQEEYIHDVKELQGKKRLVLNIRNQLIALHVAVFALRHGEQPRA